MNLFRNVVIMLVVAVCASAGAIAGYFIGTKNEHRRLTELLSFTYAQVDEFIQSDATASVDAVNFRRQGAKALITAFGRNVSNNTAGPGQGNQ